MYNKYRDPALMEVGEQNLNETWSSMYIRIIPVNSRNRITIIIIIFTFYYS